MKISRADLNLRLTPILLGQAVGLACGIIGVRLASHWVAPADYGRYGVFVSLTPLGLGVVFSGVLKFVGRRWGETADRAALLRGSAADIGRKIPWLVAAVAAATLVAAPGQPLAFGALLLVAALLLTVGQLSQTALQAERAHWADLSVSTAGSLSRSFLPPLAYWLCGASVFSLFGGFCAHAAILAGVAVVVLRRRPSARGGHEVLAPSREYAGPLFVVLAATGWIVAGVNRWITAWCFGAEEAGYFTLAANIATIPPALLGGLLLQFSQPVWFAAKTETPAARRALARTVDRLAAGYTLAAVVLLALLQAAMPWLIGPLVSERYAPATTYLFGAGCFMAAVSVGQFYHTLLLAADRPNACGPVDLSGAFCLVAGGIAAAAGGPEWFVRWLCVAPVVPWLVNRPLARRHLVAAG
jgi:hypothetical protein